VVAHNEESRIEAAVRSLLDQELPDGVAWTEIRVLASGCTDRTEAVVREAFAHEPLVHLVGEPQRHGKAAALNRLFREAVGDWFVLLDGDCAAAPGAVTALLGAAAREGARPVGVGPRHVPPELGGVFGGAIGFLWAVADHRALGARPGDRGRVMLDNLALLPVRSLPTIPAGTVNEAGALEAHLLGAGGSVRYAPDARVAISVPRSFPSYVRQRWRILVGDRQLDTRVGAPSATLRWEFGRRPVGTVAQLLAEGRRLRVPVASFLGLAAAESAARILALVDYDRQVGKLVVWPRIPSASAPSMGGSGE
jgi:glycosyltransferase involved in cell wall biosynthesis